MNNKCVYLHKENNGRVFYVGSGTIKRAKQKELSTHSGKATGRGLKYSEYVKNLNFDYSVEIVSTRLSVNDSINLEQQLFDFYKETIVNTNRPSHERSMSASLFHEHLYISELSPSGLSWKTDRYSGNRLKVCKYKAGDSAGFINDNGYWIIRLNGQDYAAHRVVAVLFGHHI